MTVETAPRPVSATPDLEAAWQAFHHALLGANRILLSTHENPDGDGLGSELALCEDLKAQGKDCRILNCTAAPALYHFLDPNGWLELYDKERDQDWLAGCDLAVVFDLGDFRRLRAVGQDLAHHHVVLASIDHHPQLGYESTGGESPYTYLILDYSAPSTGTLVWQYFNAYRPEPVTLPMALALYTALVTDTGSFKYDNTDERAHRMAIDLLDVGVKPYFIHKRVYEQRTHSQVRLLGVLIDHIEYSEDQHIGWCVLTSDRLKQAEATVEDVDGFSEFIRTIKDVEVSALLTEVEPGKTKVSLRSKGTLAINDVAKKLGGGGHAFASGAQINQPWQDVLGTLLPLLQAKVDAMRADGGDGSYGS